MTGTGSAPRSAAGMAALESLFGTARSQGRAALIGYLPAGYPDIASGRDLIDGLIAGGADAVEVGMPFSDPVLDGAVISQAQRASLAAGFRTRDLFGLVEHVASRGAVPVVMSYINPVLAYGVPAFARDLAAAGGAGMITPDLIVDEADAWRSAAGANDLATVFLVAPSSPPERVALTTAACSGFVYAASVMGTTGARDAAPTAAPALVARCRALTDLPIGVGLGVRTAQQAATIASYADAVIVGSAFVAAAGAAAGSGPGAAARAVRDLAAELAAGVRGSTPAGPRGPS